MITNKSVVESTKQLATTIVQEETEWLYHVMARSLAIKEGKVAFANIVYQFSLSAQYTVCSIAN